MLSTLICRYLVLVGVFLISPAFGLHFLIDPYNNRKCFYEELAKDTLVVAQYKTMVFNGDVNNYVTDQGVTIQTTVEETFDNNHRIVNQRGRSEGSVTFTAADTGLHRICFNLNVDVNWWVNTGKSIPAKMSLDIAVGPEGDALGQFDEASSEAARKSLTDRVSDINHRIFEIRRDQYFQREREAMFRDDSEKINSRVVKWSIVQLIVLGITCAWQLNHLRSFFLKQKIV